MNAERFGGENRKAWGARQIHYIRLSEKMPSPCGGMTQTFPRIDVVYGNGSSFGMNEKLVYALRIADALQSVEGNRDENGRPIGDVEYDPDFGLVYDDLPKNNEELEKRLLEGMEHNTRQS